MLIERHVASVVSAKLEKIRPYLLRNHRSNIVSPIHLTALANASWTPSMHSTFLTSNGIVHQNYKSSEFGASERAMVIHLIEGRRKSVKVRWAYLACLLWGQETDLWPNLLRQWRMWYREGGPLVESLKWQMAVMDGLSAWDHQLGIFLDHHPATPSFYQLTIVLPSGQEVWQRVIHHTQDLFQSK